MAARAPASAFAQTETAARRRVQPPEDYNPSNVRDIAATQVTGHIVAGHAGWGPGEVVSSAEDGTVRQHGPAAAMGNVVNSVCGSGSEPGEDSRRRDCHFTDTPSPFLWKNLIKTQGGAIK